MQDKLTLSDFYKAKEALEKANVKCTHVWLDEWHSFQDIEKTMLCKYDSICAIATTCPAPQACLPTPTNYGYGVKCKAKSCEKQEVENTMNTNSERDYLARRLENVAYGKDFSMLFNLNSPTTPSTYKELIDWIKNGKYELDEKRTKFIDATIENQDGSWYGNAFDGIKFTANPQPDFDGYAKAKVEAKKLHQNAKDIIMTADAAAGLKALQDFEAWMPTVGTPAN